MTIIQQLKTGSDTLIHASAQTSEGEPVMAIAQLLFSAAVLAKTIGMTLEAFQDGVTLAIKDTFQVDPPQHEQCDDPDCWCKNDEHTGNFAPTCNCCGVELEADPINYGDGLCEQCHNEETKNA